MGPLSLLSSWVGKQIRLTDGAFWATFLGGENWAGKSVTIDTALQVSTFWSCVRLTASVIGSMPLGLYKKDALGGRVSQTANPLYGVLHDMPNAEQTAVEFWEGIVAGILCWGNAFAEKVTDPSGLLALKPPMLPGQVIVERKKEGSLVYKFWDRGKYVEFPEEKIFHVKGFGFGGDVGLSPLTYARQTLSTSMATDEAAARTFSNGMRPGGFFTYDKTLTSDQRDQAKKVLIDPYMGASNAHKIGILEAGFKWQDVMMNPEDAQMLESRAFNVEEICRWLGTPPILVGHSSQGQTMWGSGVEQIVLGWLTLGLSPYLKRIEQSIWRSLLTSNERQEKLYAEFNTDYLLRADSAARSALYTAMAQNGIMTRNEIRAKENLPRAEGGDILTVQVNLTDLAKLGQATPAAAAARAALINWLREGETESGDKKSPPRLELVK